MLDTVKGDKVYEQIFDKSGELRFVVTGKETGESFVLYSVSGSSFTRLGRGSDPIELKAKHKIYETLAAK